MADAIPSGLIARGRWTVRWPVLAAILLLLAGFACDQSSGPGPQTKTPTTQAGPTTQTGQAVPVAGEWHAFEGTWTASGTRRTLQMGSDQRAAIFELTGSLLLTGPERPALGFQARAIGFSDNQAGMQGRCVWTDEHGEMVYSSLKGQSVGSGNHIVGTFIGGTGRYADVSGEYSFQWQYVIDTDDGAVSGRVVDLKGRARLGGPATAPSPATATTSTPTPTDAPTNSTTNSPVEGSGR